MLSLTSGGSTALYEAVCQASRALEDQRRADGAAGDPRLYGVILLSDGRDTAGKVTENQMFATCLPTNAETDGIKLFSIRVWERCRQGGPGSHVQRDRWALIAANPAASISNVYLSISAEQ